MTRRRIAAAAITLVVLWGVNHLALGWAGNPLAAVREHATNFGYEDDQLDLLGGGYERGLVGMSAHGTFQVRDGENLQKLFVEVRRPTFLFGWSLHTYAVTPFVPGDSEPA